MARELSEWLSPSLEDIIVEGGLWETGIGSKQIRVWFEECRGSRISIPKETISSGLGHIGRKEGRVMVACLKDWLEGPRGTQA